MEYDRNDKILTMIQVGQKFRHYSLGNVYECIGRTETGKGKSLIIIYRFQDNNATMEETKYFETTIIHIERYLKAGIWINY